HTNALTSPTRGPIIFTSHSHHRNLHSFPTRRSSDLTSGRANAASQGDSFRPEFDNIRVDTVANGVILRGPVYDIIGAGQDYTIGDRKSTRLNSSHRTISYAVFCLKKRN